MSIPKGEVALQDPPERGGESAEAGDCEAGDEGEEEDFHDVFCLESKCKNNRVNKKIFVHFFLLKSC